MGIDKSKIKTWFVTGASSGIGKEMCNLLLQRGYNVIAVARRVPELSHGGALCLSVDVTKPEEIGEAVKAGIEKFGRIDVLMNNAGISSNSTLEEISNEEMRQVIEVNFWGTFNTMKALLPHFRENKHGTIVNNTSQSGISIRAYGSAYCSSKHAIEGLTATIWHEAQRFCRVMALEMGFFAGTGVLKNHSRQGTSIEEYKKIPAFYKKFERDFNNDLPTALSFVLNTVEQEKLPRRLMLGKDALIQIQTEVDAITDDLKRSRKKALLCAIPKSQDKTIMFCGLTIYKKRVKEEYTKYSILGIHVKVKHKNK